ncbi:nucleotide pyrophosphohydrolase [Luteimonas lutimaris]|uniref:Nucleotide pyrophosphohydrolase n=1 Tax=Luteimonas lutimaris TaxID=698645 RepID=A0ABP7MZR9_9GAMM
MSQDIQALQAALRAFAQERDWEQFHSPKNLAAALSVEAAELLEHFQWLSEEQSRNMPAEKRAQAADEVADVLLYALQLADKLGIDPLDAAWKKLGTNGEKYPVERARGRSTKYTEL